MAVIIVIAFSSDNYVNQQFTVRFLHWNNSIYYTGDPITIPSPILTFD